jgi:hypothetical protein
LNIGSIFARQNEKAIPSFAIDGNILSPAVLDETFPAEETIDRIMDFFDRHNMQTLPIKFINFCDKHGYWLHGYFLDRVLSAQIGINDFS